MSYRGVPFLLERNSLSVQVEKARNNKTNDLNLCIVISVQIKNYYYCKIEDLKVITTTVRAKFRQALKVLIKSFKSKA